MGCLLTTGGVEVPVYTNEFWTSRQRQAHSLHEISYRACFKPQLPAFFIDRLTRRGEVVYDPFMGRGTTLVEAALRGRVPWGCDINPVSARLAAPRLNPPRIQDLAARLAALPLKTDEPLREDLLVFYHPEVLEALCALRSYFARPEADAVDAWLRMVATNRLTGHSNGFFSVYTLPPNQAVSVQSQQRINASRKQAPPLRDILDILEKKSAQLLQDLSRRERAALARVLPGARLLTASCDHTSVLPPDSVSLVVTSPPFLKEVDYRTDNWLRCWFHGLDSKDIPIWQSTRLAAWRERMTAVFRELHRVVKPGGWIAFEVGEVVRGRIRLEEAVVPAATDAGLVTELIMINAQEFTKTSQCWGVDNQIRGTNTNRIVLLRKP
ncbi:MAG: site-specific DNA-methyltransferase [Verrucomicrobiaceae bacterium]|nr:MAG: site-specific DNA-methyltransferase [Verrucomicrobiaceae bacterium]